MYRKIVFEIIMFPLFMNETNEDRNATLKDKNKRIGE